MHDMTYMPLPYAESNEVQYVRLRVEDVPVSRSMIDARTISAVSSMIMKTNCEFLKPQQTSSHTIDTALKSSSLLRAIVASGTFPDLSQGDAEGNGESNDATRAPANPEPESNSVYRFTRTLFTQEKVCEETLGKHVIVLKDIINSADINEPAEVAPLSNDSSKELLKSIKILKKRKLLTRIPVEVLLELLPVFTAQVKYALSVDPISTMQLGRGDDEWSASGVGKTLLANIAYAIDVVSASMILMSAENVDRRFLCEELIESSFQLYKHALQQIVYPIIDKTEFENYIDSSTFQGVDNHQGTEVSHTPSVSSKKRLKNSKSRGSISGTIHKTFGKKGLRLVMSLCELMNHIHDFILSVRLEDRLILSLTSVSLSTFLVEPSRNSSLLQLSATNMLRGIFLRYKQHRDLILEDVFSVLIKLPTHKRTLRLFKLNNSQKSVQMISALLIRLIQCCISSINDHTMIWDNSTKLVESLHELETRLDDAKTACRHFVGYFLKKCMKKDEENDYKLLLTFLTEDLITMFTRPEWPGAELMLQVLSTTLAGIVSANINKEASKRGLESHYSLMALDLLGKICSSIKHIMKSSLASPIKGDYRHENAIKEHRLYIEKHFTQFLDENSHAREIECEIIYKHIAISYMSERVVIEQDQLDARKYLVALFVRDSNLSSGIPSQENSMWTSYWDPPRATVDATAGIVVQSETIKRIMMEIMINSSLCRSFDRLFAHVMALLSQDKSTFRARVIKTLSSIVDVDPMLMADDNVRTVVCRCFLDEGISVRQATVDLVGRYMCLQPELVDRYYDMVVERLRDKGVSVRKSVLKILRELLVQYSDRKIITRSLLKMVERIGDPYEETSVKDIIIENFQEIWFGKGIENSRAMKSVQAETVANANHLPPGWIEVPSSDGLEPLSYSSTDGKTFNTLDEAWAHSGHERPSVMPSALRNRLISSKSSDLVIFSIIEVVYNLNNVDWFVSLIRKLIYGDSKSKRSKKEKNTEVYDRCKSMVNGIMECLLQIEEGIEFDMDINFPGCQLVACLKSIHVFCSACPQLVVQHMQTLTVYLKGDVKLPRDVESRIFSIVSSILCDILPLIDRPKQNIVKDLEKDLTRLIYQCPPSVVTPSVRCLSTLVTHVHQDPEIVFSILEKFYSYLYKFMSKADLKDIPANASSSIQRALFTVGLIAKNVDLDEYDVGICEYKDAVAPHRLRKHHILESLYIMYSSYLKKNGNLSCLAKAVQGIGFLFSRRPKFLLRAQQECTLENLLTSSDFDVRLQTLRSLSDILQDEASRLETGTAKEVMSKRVSKKEQVQGDQEADASLIGGVMQAQLKNILRLCMNKKDLVREEAVTLVSILLTQGLISPLLCIPTLVALETDRSSSIRETIHNQLLELQDKFPNIVVTPSIQGIKLSHSFQTRVFGECKITIQDKEGSEYCLFGKLYTFCIRKIRSQRHMFLKALIRLFEDKAMLTAQNKKMIKSMDFLCYVTQLLSKLPYDDEEEPLYIVYLINRTISLKAGGLIEELSEKFKKEVSKLGIEIVEAKNVDVEPGVIDALQSKCATACSLSLLLRLKQFLKLRYGLSDEKCQTYSPSETAKNVSSVITIADTSARIQLPGVEDLCSEFPLLTLWNQYKLLVHALKDDQESVDFDPTQKKKANTKSRGRKKRGKKRKVEADYEDEEFVVGF